ncbi:MAG: CoA-binding protein [Deltaproteobacteria bacterium]|nr:CoA-binding protein [Deltaproteobacteria bacterium]MBW2304374.1 CoA-binding protein [Deltaproteobacteria bacterium]
MDFRPLFQPKTMAVVGVSLQNYQHPANVIFNKNHLRYPVKVFAVNPRGGLLQGETVFRKISDIPEKVDLAVIAVRAEHVPEVLSECIESGTGAAAVISGGFAEIGRNDLQETLVSMAREADFPFIGPNCLGIYVPAIVDSFFLPIERMVRPEQGNVAVISQSGGILVDHMVKFREEGIGLSLGVSIGNKALIREIDLLEYLDADPRTGVIAFYIEGFGRGEGRDFVLTASRCSKPVIVIKSGKTPGGVRAVSSHTASLAGDYEVFSQVLAQMGVVEAKDELELISFCESLSCYQRPIEGKIGIITGSGGHGALAVDVCSAHGLLVPGLKAQEQAKIRQDLSKSVRDIASLGNPLDLTGSAVDEDFVAAAAHLSKIPEIDCVLLLLLPYLPGISSDLGARLSNIYQKEGKVLIAYVPHVEKYRMLIEGFELNGVPVAHSIEAAVLMAEALRRCQPC